MQGPQLNGNEPQGAAAGGREAPKQAQRGIQKGCIGVMGQAGVQQLMQLDVQEAKGGLCLQLWAPVAGLQAHHGLQVAVAHIAEVAHAFY